MNYSRTIELIIPFIILYVIITCIKEYNKIYNKSYFEKFSETLIILPDFTEKLNLILLILLHMTGFILINELKNWVNNIKALCVLLNELDLIKNFMMKQ